MGFSEDTRWFFRSALEWHSEMESCNPGDTRRGTTRGNISSSGDQDDSQYQYLSLSLMTTMIVKKTPTKSRELCFLTGPALI